MSKLYDVISRLDKISPQDEKDTPALEIPFHPPPRSRSPLLRVVLLSVLLILLGLGCLAGIVWWKNSLAVKPSPVKNHLVSLSQVEQQIPASTGTAADIPVPSTVNAAFSSSVFDEEIAVEDIEKEKEISALEQGSEHRMDESAGVSAVTSTRAAEGNAAPAETIASTAVSDGKGTVVEPDALPVRHNISTPPTALVFDESSQISRWLYQAEQHRRNGEWAAAADLFRRVWNISGSPAVANNLAACLIRLGQLGEAGTILDKALQKTPDDRDLFSNRQLVEQLRHSVRP